MESIPVFLMQTLQTGFKGKSTVLSLSKWNRLKLFCAPQIIYRTGAGWPAGRIGRQGSSVKRDGAVGLVRAGPLPKKFAQ